MLPKFLRRADTDTLIWEYFDQESTPSRLALLQKRLRLRKADRIKFVESAMLHSLLIQYFAKQVSQSDSMDSDKPRRRGKFSAA